MERFYEVAMRHLTELLDERGQGDTHNGQEKAEELWTQRYLDPRVH